MHRQGGVGGLSIGSLLSPPGRLAASWPSTLTWDSHAQSCICMCMHVYMYGARALWPSTHRPSASSPWATKRSLQACRAIPTCSVYVCAYVYAVYMYGVASLQGDPHLFADGIGHAREAEDVDALGVLAAVEGDRLKQLDVPPRHAQLHMYTSLRHGALRLLPKPHSQCCRARFHHHLISCMYICACSQCCRAPLLHHPISCELRRRPQGYLLSKQASKYM